MSSKKRAVEIPSPCKFELNASCSGSSEASSSSETAYPHESLLDDIWCDVDAFMDLKPAQEPCDNESDDDDVEYFAPQRHSSTVIGRMPCGDIHVCKLGKFCPFLEPNEDRVMVCVYTGLEHGPEQTDEFFDLNGGSGKRSGDPDQSCGELLHGKWTKRADPMVASRMAFNMSNNISEDQVFECVQSDESRGAKKPLKRGAKCVGEEEEEQASKKSRSSKKNVASRETVAHLHTEASMVITKMIDHKKASCFKNKAPPGRIERKCAPVDPRMCDQNFVFQKSLQRYLKNCSASGAAPNLDTIHNLSLMAQEVSNKSKQQQKTSESTDGIRTAKFRNLCSALIVSLWSAACKSPYMEKAKRGTDAYRPFICGVLYGFKRGIKLDNGCVLVPQCEQLSEALPVLRGTGGNTFAKTLHSSSHRGLCTLSRCIASVPKEQQDEIFRDVFRIAHQFSQQTFNKGDI